MATKRDLESLENNLMAGFRAALASQTRAMFLAIVTIVLTMAGLTLGLTFAALNH